MYDFISSSTVALSSVFLMFNIATHYKTILASYDIKGAFLHAKFKKDDEVTYIRVDKEVAALWVEQDPTAAPFIDEQGCLTLELDKFIYGLKQSPYKFQELLNSVLLKLGYKRLVHDECMYIKHDDNGGFSLLSTHVDDILQACTSKELYDELSAGLIAEFQDISPKLEATSYLGMTIDRSEDMSYIRLTQKGLVEECLEKFADVCSAGTKKTPAATNLFADRQMTPETWYPGISEVDDMSAETGDETHVCSKTNTA
jgi:hypothetical protein